VPRARPRLTRRCAQAHVPAPSCARPRTRSGPRLTVHRARAYKSSAASAVLLRTSPNFPDPGLSSSELYAARPSDPSAGHRGQSFL
jgi:hypothetical protein